MAATIRDVAARIGVSPSTVSRVLNDKGLISSQTKQRVFQAMQELDYHPNTLAQNFAKGKAGAILLAMDARVATDFSNTFFYQSVFAVETVFQQYGYHLIVASGQQGNITQNPVQEMILGRRVDGLILPPAMVSIEMLDTLERADLPFVVLGQPAIEHNRYIWVDVDNALGAQQAVKHLYNQGYRRMAFVAENEKAVFMKKRLAGYKAVLAELGLACPDQYQVKYTSNEEEYAQRIHNLSDTAVTPDAYICSDNIMAFHTLRALKKCGRRIPSDVGVVTFDNYPLAEYTDPPLTSINIDTYKMGQEAAELLMRGIQGIKPEYNKYLIPTEIIIRKSTLKRN